MLLFMPLMLMLLMLLLMLAKANSMKKTGKQPTF
jgi:hypothetical protein